jgi:cyanophycinase-like exopeptidase
VYASPSLFFMVPNVLVLPHYDALPGLLRGLALRGLPAELTVLGIDEKTALVQLDAGWQVQGRAGVELRRAREACTFWP